MTYMLQHEIILIVINIQIGSIVMNYHFVKILFNIKKTSFCFKIKLFPSELSIIIK
jgi:hypothetical protein